MDNATFVQKLEERGLYLQIVTEANDTRLILQGKMEALTDPIRRYIREHRDELRTLVGERQQSHIADGSGPDLGDSQDQSSTQDDLAITNEVYAIRCYVCQKQLVEAEYESTWRLTNDGLEFCNHCWSALHIESAAKAHTWLCDRGLSVDLEARIVVFVARSGCGLCGGHDWTVDEQDGALVCPCVLLSRSETVQRDRERAGEFPVLDASSEESQATLCPLCAEASRQASGVASIGFQYGKPMYANWQTPAKKTPGRPFHYVWVAREQCWICAGCQDEQKSLPVRKVEQVETLAADGK